MELEPKADVDFSLAHEVGVLVPHIYEWMSNILYIVLNRSGLYLMPNGGDVLVPVFPGEVVEYGQRILLQHV